LDKTGAFIPEAMDDTKNALQEYVDICSDNGIKPRDIIATATEASRVASNAKDFFKGIEEELQLKVNTITSKAEAYYSAKGILFNSTFPEKEVVIMDIGGASTELIKVNPFTSEIQSSISMPFGAVRISNWLADKELDKNLKQIKFNFDSELSQFQSKKLYCVAGTMTSIGNIHLKNKTFNESEVHGMQFKTEDIRGLFDKYRQVSAEEMLKEYPFLGKRSKTIHGGFIVALRVLDWIGALDIQISTYGLRYGTLVQGHIREEDIHGS
jgi:exopolyphosphatase/guanosine-5'-triphosphate,3'-diphosphate pyrophosphatase